MTNFRTWSLDLSFDIYGIPDKKAEKTISTNENFVRK